MEKHYMQIAVDREDIVAELKNISWGFNKNLLCCILQENNETEYKLSLLSAASKLYQLSRLVYKKDGRYSKLNKSEYDKYLFKDYLESEIEIAERVRESGNDSVLIGRAIKCINVIEPLIVEWVALNSEQIYIYEFAYLIDYVIKKRGILTVSGKGESLYFGKYPEFNPNRGIGAEFEKYSF